MAPLTDQPNAQDKEGWTPIHKAAMEGTLDIVKFLAPLTDNSNPVDEFGLGPRDFAMMKL